MEHNAIDERFATFLNSHGIAVIDYTQQSKDVIKTDIVPISDEIITDALRAIANPINLPALVICKTGRIFSSVLVACLRKLQKWSLMSVLEEFRRYSIGSRMQQHLEQLVELYDIEQIEINEQSSSFFPQHSTSSS
jgi:tyrosine-protein phosphatase SIW14